MNFDFDEFLLFIKKERARIPELSNPDSHAANVFTAVAKLAEENGEFVREIFINLKLCRPEKICENSEKLAEEFADTVITLFLVAETLGIDTRKAIEAKKELIKDKRWPK